MKVLLTGATGFVGRVLARKLSSMDKIELNLAIRANSLSEQVLGVVYKIPALDGNICWQDALSSVDVVIHAAGRAHITSKKNNSLEEFRKVNVEATLNLARQAVLNGVKRFIFISSIKVNGDVTEYGHPFTADDIPEPVDFYGISKFEAEIGLKNIGINSNMEVVIIRPPLIYGPGVKANFRLMMKCVQYGLPLPFGSIKNARSFVMIDNLVDLIVICLDHAAAANQTFLVSDGDDVSTPQLLRLIAELSNIKLLFLFSFPVGLIKLGSQLMGFDKAVNRLSDSLQVDIEKTCRLLNWSPRLTLEDGLKRTIYEENH